MTSKNLFFNLMKEDLRRRLWVLILSSLVFFFALPVASVMRLQSWLGGSLGSDREALLDGASKALAAYTGTNLLFLLIAFVGALFCAFSGYAYLHSRKQVDFYHSLPVRRETLFFVQFLDGCLLYFVPYLGGLLLTYLLAGSLHVMSTQVLAASLRGLLLCGIAFLVCYLVAVVAVLLTGKLLLSFLGTAVLYLYAPAMYGLVMGYQALFFTTVGQRDVSWESALLTTRFLSPVSYCVWLFLECGERGNIGWGLLSFAVITAVLLAVCVLLYRERKSEKAGMAMAFSVSEPIIRILLVIPIGLVGGVVFMSFQYQSSAASAVAWLCFGVVVGAVLTHGIIESFYHLDIKRCLSHKLQLLVTAAVTVFAALSFYFDFFGYDTYLPDKSDVRSMAISTYVLNRSVNYYDEEGFYVSAEDYQLKHMSVEHFDALYEMARLGVELAKESRLLYSRFTSEDYFGGDTQMFDYTIRYELKNGKEVVRYYRYSLPAVIDLIGEAWDQEDYKKGSDVTFSWEEFGHVPQTIRCEKDGRELTLTLRDEEKQELIRRYQKECLEQRFEEIRREAPVMRLEVEYMVDQMRRTQYLYLYPSMQETLAFLAQHGFDVGAATDTADILEIRLYYNETLFTGSGTSSPATGSVEEDEDRELFYYMKRNGRTYYTDKEGNIFDDNGVFIATEEEFLQGKQGKGEIVLVDPEEIAALYPYLIEIEYARVYLYLFETGDYRVEVVYAVDDYGNTREERYEIREEDVPQFLRDRMAGVR